MPYSSENRPQGSPARGQRNSYAPDEAAARRYAQNGYSGSDDSRRQQGGPVPPGPRQAKQYGYEPRPFVLSPRGVSQRAAPRKRPDPLAVVAVAASALALILGIALIVVLTSRKSVGSDAAVPTSAPAYTPIPTEAAMPFPTTPSAGFIVITPSPAPTANQVPTSVPVSTPRPNQIFTPSPGKTSTGADVLAEAETAAEGRSGYSTVSDKDVPLEVPADSAFLRTPFLKRVNAGESGRAIYIMPKPIPGNGVLGTLYHGTQVTVLAETEFYYFFVTQDGRAGWNGKSYFMDP